MTATEARDLFLTLERDAATADSYDAIAAAFQPIKPHAAAVARLLGYRFRSPARELLAVLERCLQCAVRISPIRGK